MAPAAGAAAERIEPRWDAADPEAALGAGRPQTQVLQAQAVYASMGPPAPGTEAGFAAYGVTLSDDPLTEAMRGLIAGTAVQDHQIALLWQAVETLSRRANADCLPADASRRECFDADKLRELVDK